MREDQTSKQKHTVDEKLKEAHNESVEVGAEGEKTWYFLRRLFVITCHI